MGQEDRLRPLQVGVARHDQVLVFTSPIDYNCLKLAQQGADGGDLVLDEEVHIGDHLVVARARRMQLAAHRTDQFGQPLLNVQMNIFEHLPKWERPGDYFSLYLLEARDNLLRLRHRDDPLPPEHAGVGDGSAKILAPQAPVKGEGRGEPLHRLIRLLGKPPAPELGHRSSSVPCGQGLSGPIDSE